MQTLQASCKAHCAPFHTSRPAPVAGQRQRCGLVLRRRGALPRAAMVGGGDVVASCSASSNTELHAGQANPLQQQQQQQALQAGQQEEQQQLPTSDRPLPATWRPRQLALGALGLGLAASAAALAPGLAAADPLHGLAALGGLGSAAGSSGAQAFIPGIVGDDPLREGFVSGLLLIFFSEIGDKTFFIALLLALQQPRALVFAGTFGALAIMTIISVALGLSLHQLDNLLPATGLPWDDLLAVTLLLFFGVTTLLDADSASETAAEEKSEAQEVVDSFGSSAAALSLVASTFSLVFAAEWGDKSFLATIALAAASSPLGVTAGAVAGHGVATAIAVLGGSFLGKYLDERAAKLVGGSLFLVFAAATIFDIAAGAH